MVRSRPPTVTRTKAENPGSAISASGTPDAGLTREYGERIPVVAIDGVETFEFFVDPDALGRALDRVDS